MRIIGITGGVGCGKSTVLNLIKNQYNAYIIMADDIAKSLYKPGSSLVYKISQEFGEGCISTDGSVNRNYLADIIFNDDDKRNLLNSIVHPLVKKEIIKKIDELKRENSFDYILVEAALFFEEHYEEFCDEVWYITADINIRKERLKTDRGYTDEKISLIINSQMSQDEYIKKCDHVIDNSGNLSYTQSQLVKLL